MYNLNLNIKQFEIWKKFNTNTKNQKDQDENSKEYFEEFKGKERSKKRCEESDEELNRKKNQR